MNVLAHALRRSIPLGWQKSTTRIFLPVEASSIQHESPVDLAPNHPQKLLTSNTSRSRPPTRAPIALASQCVHEFRSSSRRRCSVRHGCSGARVVTG